MEYVMTKTDVIILTVALALYFLSWVVVRLACTHKYFFCQKGNCKKCKNWQCKQYAFRPVVGKDEYLFDVYSCRACGNGLDYLHANNYCPNCGHKVLWNKTGFVGAKR